MGYSSNLIDFHLNEPNINMRGRLRVTQTSRPQSDLTHSASPLLKT